MVKLDIKLEVSKRFITFFVFITFLFGLFAISYAGNGQIDTADNSIKLNGLSSTDNLTAASGASNGEGGVLILVSGYNNVPSCPVGWISAREGYYIHSGVGGLNEGLCFDNMMINLELGSNSGWSTQFSASTGIYPTYNYQTHRCSICVQT